MDLKKIDLYYIDEKYIDYLRNFDKRVFYNKKETRPYVGIVYEFRGFKYFAPLASPKIKHLKIKENALDVFKIKKGELGIININNMIPAPKFVLKLVLPNVEDDTYRTLLENQLFYLTNHRAKLYKKIENLYRLYSKKLLYKRIFDRCCDFKLLEEKCLEYENNNILINN